MPLKREQKMKNFFTVINGTFQQKIDAGLEVPNYPQYQDVFMFLKVIRNTTCCISPFEVKLDSARIQ